MPINYPDLITAIDAEISRLQQARNLLAGATSTPKKKVHIMSAEAREKIAAAQRKRWASQKKAAKQ